MPGIEVEKDVVITDDTLQKIESIADSKKEATIIDTYYDSTDYSLTTKDWWLRNRDNRFELKLPVKSSGDFMNYSELETDGEIIQALDLEGTPISEEMLKKNNLAPFCTITTKRTTYNIGDIHVVHDVVDLDGNKFIKAEIEMMIEDPEKTDIAQERINEFLSSYGITGAPKYGKVLEYLKIKNPEHFEALRKAGVTQ
jgi:adenylate cyclase class IV